MTHTLEGARKPGKRHTGWQASLKRWCVFNLVGLIGIGIQILTLAVLRGWVGMHYLLATALAVEAAVLHNFLWHERWTWLDRTCSNPGGMLSRLARFNLTTGAISIGSNVALMTLFVGELGLHYMPANLATIALCSVVNFLVSDRFVFKDDERRTMTSTPIGSTSKFPVEFW